MIATFTRRTAFAAAFSLPALSLPASVPARVPVGRNWITGRQARAIRIAIAERTGRVRLGQRGTGMIRRAICDAFAVPALGELPRARFNDVLRFIRNWTPPESLDPAIRACQHWRTYHTALWRALDRMYDHPPAPGYDVAAHFARHHDRAFELLTIALHTPATTIAGVHAKFLIYMENYGYCAEPGTPGWQSAQGDPEYGAIVALAADTERLAA